MRGFEVRPAARRLWTRLLVLFGVRTLEIEAEAHTAVLPALRRQLEESTADMERAVVGVCGSFQGIVAEAREAVADTSRLMGQGDGSEGVEATLTKSRATIEHLLERIQHSSEVSLRAAARIEGVESALNGITKALAEVENIAFANRMLALNAKIESVHVGEAGAGFGIVADEITAQASRSTAITDEMAATVRNLRKVILGAAEELKALASDDRVNLAESRREVRDALDEFSRANLGMREALEAAQSRGVKLADDVSHAVVGLQFQDRVTQRIGHVVEALDQMEQAFRRCLAGEPGAAEGNVRRAEIVAGLEQSCTMHGERAALSGAIEEQVTDTESVELF